MRGRKPKPTAMRLVEGNRGHRPMNKREPKPALTAPPRPKFLDAEGRKAWKYVIGALEGMGTLAVSDQGVVAAYCQWWSQIAKAERHIVEEGEVLVTPKGAQVKSPWVNIAATARKELVRE